MGPAAAAVALVALAVAAPARGDVADYIGRPVASVQLVLDGRETTERALTQLVVVRPGQPFEIREVRETVLHLYALGRFEDVQVDARREGTGVAVRFELTAARPVSGITFAGDLSQPGIDAGRLKRAIVERAGPTPPVTRLSELERILEAALRAQGYLRPKVSGAPVVDAAATRTTLVFTVDPGTRAVIGTIDVSGPESARAEFLSQAQLMTGAPFVRDAIVARIDKYVASRRSHGYYEAKVAWADLPIDGDRTVNLTFTVDPGGTCVSCSPAIHFRAPSTIWCPWSARGPSTKTCSKTRPRESRTR